MIRAYDEVYLQPAQDNMAFMLDYDVNDAGFTIEDFFNSELFRNLEQEIQ